jgi:hypothetical protein
MICLELLACQKAALQGNSGLEHAQWQGLDWALGQEDLVQGPTPSHGVGRVKVHVTQRL